MKKIVFVLLALTSCSPASKIKNLVEANVSITNFAKNHGGSGSILESSDSESLILTNRHVCEILVTGGLVNTEDGRSHIVTGFKVARGHDLCLVQVMENLKAKTQLAFAPIKPFEKVTIIGHPSLFPTIITEGWSSKKVIVPVGGEPRPCTAEELQDPNNAILCAIFGGLPQITIFEALLVSATIMPGSSGSPVYNENGLLVGVVFAGKGELSYGLIVPYEYVVQFLNEATTQSFTRPNSL